MEVVAHHFLNDLAGPRNLIKMCFSVQRSVVKSFEFNDKKFQSVHVKGEECLVSRDVYMAIEYEKENGKKAIKNLVPQKYKLHFEDINPSLNQREDIFLLHQDTALLKGPGLYCFLLCCKKPKAGPFMECVMEIVLPRELEKIASAIEEKVNQMQVLEFTNETHQQKILRLIKRLMTL